ncbi:alpha/beta hydrolase [Muricauda sp. MAR_2010_75]|uniref:alpha/beta hydrolase n=1 Tax=Allomuricauda sp. MAR_2010_75 TaxID=1250232 RepID=UPI00055AC012|nr:alpha/beta hydrolase [Muricauda sp. MAR_2010_75]
MKHFKTTSILAVLLVFVDMGISAQDTIMPLWPNKIPNQEASNEKERVETDRFDWVTNVQQPTIEVYLPTKSNANGQAVVIFPGGGYYGLAYDWEGIDMAKALNSKGVAGIVVKYRLPISKSIVEGKEVVPLQDAQRAMRLVKSKAAEWNISEGKIGIMGFSAGGHLASTLGTHYDDTVYEKQDEADELSARPDFMALIYPVISMDNETTHSGSKGALLGENPSDELANRFSANKNVTKDTPPAFLLHAQDDDAVPVENSILMFSALKKEGIPVTMHIYSKGGHGFSLALKDQRLKNWISLLYDWLDNLE